MADVAFGFVQDFGPGGGVGRARGGGALPTACRSTRSAERRRDGQARAGRHRVRRPRWVRDAGRGAGRGAHRLRALGSVAVSPARSRRRGSTAGHASALPGGGRRGGQLIVREAGGLVAFRPARTRSARRSTSRPRSPWSRRARRGASRAGRSSRGRSLTPGSPRDETPAGEGSGRLSRGGCACTTTRGMVDWQLGGEGGRRRRGAAAPGGPGAVPGTRASVRTRASASSGVHGAHAPRGRCRCRGGGPPRVVDANLRRSAACSIPSPTAIGAHRPAGRRGGGAAGAVLGARGRRISGFLAGRVLGQYEFAVLDPTRPPAAVRGAQPRPRAGTLEADADQLLRWVALHEMTHALQFGGVPWLREHLAGMVRELAAALDVDPGGCFAPARPRDDLRGAGRHRARGRLAAVVVGPERREMLDGIQAFMARPRGLRRARDGRGRRRRARGPAAAARRHGPPPRRAHRACCGCSSSLIGIELKLRQYQRASVLRRRRGARRDRRRSTASGRARTGSRRWPSSTTPPAGSQRTAPAAA